jgi:serralysin
VTHLCSTRRTDFESAYDQIFLDDLIFKGLGIGTTSGTAISNAMFAANIADIATSTANEAQIVYETDTGKLFYDADGQDGVAATQFALLSTMPTLTAANFAII